MPRKRTPEPLQAPLALKVGVETPAAFARGYDDPMLPFKERQMAKRFSEPVADPFLQSLRGQARAFNRSGTGPPKYHGDTD